MGDAQRAVEKHDTLHAFLFRVAVGDERVFDKAPPAKACTVKRSLRRPVHLHRQSWIARRALDVTLRALLSTTE